MIEFIKYNNNPYGRLTGDCVIRAISLAVNKDYNEVLSEIVEICKTTGYYVTDYNCYKKYLAQNGFRIMFTHKGLTVKEIVELCSNDNKNVTLVMRMSSRHVTVSKNGKVYDTVDCLSYPVNFYWMKMEE